MFCWAFYRSFATSFINPIIYVEIILKSHFGRRENVDFAFYTLCCYGRHVIKLLKVRKEAKIRNRYNQVIHLTEHTTLESDKNTIKHNIQESKEASPFPA